MGMGKAGNLGVKGMGTVFFCGGGGEKGQEVGLQPGNNMET